MKSFKLKYGICSFCFGSIIPIINRDEYHIKEDLLEFIKKIEIEKDVIIDPELLFTLKNIDREVHFGFMSITGKFVPLCNIDLDMDDELYEEFPFEWYSLLDDILRKNKKGNK